MGNYHSTPGKKPYSVLKVCEGILDFRPCKDTPLLAFLADLTTNGLRARSMEFTTGRLSTTPDCFQGGWGGVLSFWLGSFILLEPHSWLKK